jgi:hypothetical protein
MAHEIFSHNYVTVHFPRVYEARGLRQTQNGGDASGGNGASPLYFFSPERRETNR